jgi:hypothetical protein
MVSIAALLAPHRPFPTLRFLLQHRTVVPGGCVADEYIQATKRFFRAGKQILELFQVADIGFDYDCLPP